MNTFPETNHEKEPGMGTMGKDSNTNTGEKGQHLNTSGMKENSSALQNDSGNWDDMAKSGNQGSGTHLDEHRNP